MMLPTDMALKTDPEFRVYAELYAKDQDAFFKDFADAFAKLISLGTKEQPEPTSTEIDEASAGFREAAMHGSLDTVKRLSKKADVHAVEKSSGRTALHKAAFWGHDGTVGFLVDECKLDVNVKDFDGDTALHDAVRFNHEQVVRKLLDANSDVTIKNKRGQDVMGVAVAYNQKRMIELLKTHKPKSKL